jgi:hypothetical protein
VNHLIYRKCSLFIFVSMFRDLSRVKSVLVLVNRTPEHAHWLAHFCWGSLIVTAEKEKAIEISCSNARSLVTLFLGIHIVTTGNVFLCLTTIQKRKNIKTLGKPINTWYKSDSFVSITWNALTVPLYLPFCYYVPWPLCYVQTSLYLVIHV